MSKGSQNVTVSTYYAGLVFLLSHGPIDKITETYVQEKRAWQGSAGDEETYYINRPNLFGGNEREGGIKGYVDTKFGRVTQTVSSYIQDKLRGGAPTPKFTGVALAIAKRMYLGTNYYLKPWWFVASRIHVRKHGLVQWQDSLAEVPVSTTLTKNSIKSLTHKGTTAIIELYNFADIYVGQSITVANASYSNYNGTFTVTAIDIEKNTVSYTMSGTPGGDSTVTDLTISYNTPDLINGVHVIRDCLTDSSWGLGIAEHLIDEASFLAAAQTCYNEGLGFAWLWDAEKPITEFITEVEAHIQGNVYEDRATGKFKINLTRYITNTTGLITLDETNSKNVTDFKRKSLDELVNQITIKFLDNGTLKDNSFPITDSSLVQRQNGIVSKTITYSGVANLAIAEKLGIRDLRQHSTPVYSCSIECDRTAENLNKGDAFILDRPDVINAQIIMRVVKIDLGTVDKGQIRIDAVQDIFHAPDVVYYTDPDESWTDPIEYPVAVEHKLLIEAPYYMVAIRKGDSFAQGVAVDESYIGVAAVSPQNTAYSAGLWTGPEASTTNLTRKGIVDFCYSSLLAVAINKTETNLTISDETDPELLTLNSLIQLGDELMQVTAFTETTMTVVRGVLDSIPTDHNIGERIWGIGDFYATDDVAYAVGETTYVSLTTVTPKGELDLVDADISITHTGRMHLPYPPGNFKINNTYWPTSVASGDIDFSWAHRNRLLQTAGLIGYYTGDITTEPGVTYSYRLTKTSDDSVLFTADGVTTNTVTLTVAYVGEVRFRLWSVNANGDSKEEINFIFTTTV
jgi:hypothetical protein